MARKTKAPLSVQKLARHTTGKDGKIAVVVATVTGDKRLYETPKMTVCALKFTESARKQICKAGGECLTFDKLALRSPLGKGCVLLRGPYKRRKQQRHFGRAPGVPHSNTAPYTKGKSRKIEKARGRRKSRGYKV